MKAQPRRHEHPDDRAMASVTHGPTSAGLGATTTAEKAPSAAKPAWAKLSCPATRTA